MIQKLKSTDTWLFIGWADYGRQFQVQVGRVVVTLARRQRELPKRKRARADVAA